MIRAEEAVTTQSDQLQPPVEPPSRAGRVRVSRRAFIGGAAAATAVLAAGGATAVIVRERGAGHRTAGPAGTPAAAGAGIPPDALADPDVRLRHLLRRTTFAATAADVARFKGVPLDKVVDQLIEEAQADDSATESAVAALGYDRSKPADVVATWTARCWSG
jgi:hypothetical protein